MRKIFGLVIGCLCIGAAVLAIKGDEKPPVIDAKLEPYVLQWQRDMDSAGVPYDLNSIDYIRSVERVPTRLGGNKDPLTAGYSDLLLRTIYVRDTAKYDPIHVKVIVYHELAHSLLGIDEHQQEGEILGSRLIEDPEYYSENWSILLLNYIEYVRRDR